MHDSSPFYLSDDWIRPIIASVVPGENQGSRILETLAAMTGLACTQRFPAFFWASLTRNFCSQDVIITSRNAFTRLHSFRCHQKSHQNKHNRENGQFANGERQFRDS